MTPPTSNSPTLRMPPRHEMVADAIARLDTAGVRSKLFDLIDSATLRELCDRLTERGTTVADAVRWLDEQLDGSVNKNVVYRFGDHFRRIYGQVRSEHARRLARLTVEHASDGHVDTMRNLATTRLIDMIAERLVDADGLDELDSRELSATIATLDGLSRAQLKERELALKVAEGERKEAKLRADLDLVKQKLSALPAKVHALQRQLDELSKRARRREEIPQGVFDQIKRDLGVLAESPETVNHEGHEDTKGGA